MLELSRAIRFCLNGPGPVGQRPAVKHNSFSAFPPMRGLGRYYQAVLRCRGQADRVTGFFLNIKHIDQAFREHALPWLNQQLLGEPSTAVMPLGALMAGLLGRLQGPLRGCVAAVRLDLSPWYCLEMEAHAMSQLILRQQFEFSAAHRLHVAELSEEENQRIFGKCNNPSGHGHNYRVEVAVRAPVDPHGRVVDVEQLDELVDRVVIEQLDHKHLDLDVPQFARINSTVENIARVIYDMLRDVVQRELNVQLHEISVWETSKTVCTYRGEA